jgi:hypothetical protein
MGSRKLSRRDMKRGALRKREQELMFGKSQSPGKGALSAKDYDQESRHKSPPKSFTAKFEGTCATCFKTIAKGARVHYGPKGLVHHRHDRSGPVYVVCPDCHMAKPCDCTT